MKHSLLHNLKTGLALLLIAAVLLALGGCNFGIGYIPPGKGDSGELVELTFMAATEHRRAISDLTDSFNESHSQTHVTVSFTNSYYSMYLNPASDGGTYSNELPSMWFNDTGSLYGTVNRFNDQTYDLTDYATLNGWSDRFNASALSLCEPFGTHLCGYPTYIAYSGVYYDKSVFSSYILEEPTTFEEFEDLCAELVECGVTPLTGSSLLLYEQLIETCMGGVFHDNLVTLTSSWNCNGVVEALTTFQSWFQSGYYLPSDDLQYLEDGSCAMALDIASDLAEPNNLSEDDYGWYPFPSDTGRLPAYVEMVCFNKELSEEELDACMEYLDYVYSDEYGGEYVGKLPMPFADLNSQVIASPLLQEIYQCAEENDVYLSVLQSLVQPVRDTLLDRQNALCQGIATPEEVAAALQENLDK